MRGCDERGWACTECVLFWDILFWDHHGGRKVSSATIHRGGKMTKSATATPDTVQDKGDKGG